MAFLDIFYDILGARSLFYCQPVFKKMIFVSLRKNRNQERRAIRCKSALVPRCGLSAAIPRAKVFIFVLYIANSAAQAQNHKSRGQSCSKTQQSSY